MSIFTDLEKDVSKEEKQKIKSEAEEWVKSQISTKAKKSVGAEDIKKAVENKEPEPPPLVQETNVNEEVIQTQEQQPDIQSSEKCVGVIQDLPSTTTQHEALLPAEVSSSSNRECDIEQSSTVSNSTALSSVANDSCASSGILSSQESASVTLSHGDVSDPREDFEEEREERTNIRITSERETFEQNAEHSPGNNQDLE